MAPMVPKRKTAAARLDRFMDDRREDLGMTWAEVARAADITVETLRALRRGRNEPSVLTKRGIARALGWTRSSVDDIWSGGEPSLEDQPPEAEPDQPREPDLPDWLPDDDEVVRELQSMSPERRQYHLEIIEEMVRRDQQRTKEDVKAHIRRAIINPARP